MAEAYTDFADVYDELMDDVPYEAWKDRIAWLIQEYGVSQRVSGEEKTLESLEDALASERDLIVDLGCGTGTLTELLAKDGFDCIGVDNSEAMLAKAMEKKEESGSEILYLLQDMRELSLYSTVGTVVSVCDSLNYLLEEEELLQVFSLVNNYLYPRGLFIFDFNTDYKYREVIGDAVIAENREDCSFIWENFYDPEEGINEYDLTMFLKREGELFERVSETHFQRGYEAARIEELLKKAGLEVVLLRDADTDGEVTETTERVYAVARECQKEPQGL
ncbi:MAG: methyltransferase domain-containing protein [Lachnospiraceae bacterium]|jgi:SAM-dependent methyltransferase|nr:methyltransferase domain-containing protein [Lachnospiraceae bacterium]MBP5263372.1 methyltransferase domain-containing protein [Lachnospiraceae bacterium]MBQ6095180.1 methyltransferase domain-containing protein [Lachnospiraceae bacterium]